MPYSVYSVIIPTVAPYEKWGMWLIRDETLPYSKRYPWQPSGPALKGAMKNYVEVNAKSWFLQDKFSLPRYKLLSVDELRKIFPVDSNEGFSELWIELSAVGFNADKTIAMVYMEHWCTASCCCGNGTAYELKKTDPGKWQITKQTDCWVS